MSDQISLSVLRERDAAGLGSLSSAEESEFGAVSKTSQNQSPTGTHRGSAVDGDDHRLRITFLNTPIQPEQANTSHQGTASEDDGTTAPRNPIRRLGKAVKNQISSDLTAGILALSGLVCAVLVGAWGILLARQQLDLGKWSFCKSYPNDTQVLHSSTCQRYAAKQSLDDLSRRDEKSRGTATASTSPVLVLDLAPSWLIPPTVEKSSCNVVCWDLVPSAVIEQRLDVEFRLDSITRASRHMFIFAGISLVAVLMLHCYRIYRRRNRSHPAQLFVKRTLKESMLQDLSSSIDTLFGALPMICVNILFLGAFILGTAPDFRGIVEAIMTLLTLTLSQILIACISSLVGVADFHDVLHLLISRSISKTWNIPKSWMMPAALALVYLFTRSLDSMASFVFLLHVFNFLFRVLQFLGEVARQDELLEDRRRCEVHDVAID